MDNAILNIILRAKDEATTVLKNAGSTVDNTKKSIEGLGKSFMIAGGLMTAGGLTGVAVIKDWVQASSEAQIQTEKINTSIKNLADVVPGSFGQIKKAVEDTSKAFVQLGFDDEESALAMTKLLGTTKDVAKAHEYMGLAADIARYKNIGIAEASDVVNKALLGNTKIFKQYGLEVAKGADPLEMLASLQERLSGQAKAYANTYTGSMERLSVTTTNIKEKLGEAFLPILTKLADKIVVFIDKLNTINPNLLSTIAMVVGVATAFMLVVGPILFLIGFLPALAAGFTMLSANLIPAIGIILAVVAVAFALYYAFTHWNEIVAIVQGVWNAVVNFLVSLWTSITNYLGQIWIDVMTYLTNIYNFWFSIFTSIWNVIFYIFSQIWIFIQFIFGLIWAGIQIVFWAIYGFIEGILQGLWNIFGVYLTNIWNTISSIFNIIFDFIKGILTNISNWINDLLGKVHNSFDEKFNSVKTTVMNIFQSVHDWFTGKLDSFWSKVDNVTRKIKDAFEWMSIKIQDALHAIKFPHLKIGTGKITVAGHDIEYPTLGVDWYEKGGWVNRTGLAVVHEGEFVLSRGMLNGSSPIPSSIRNYNQPININAIINTEVDFDLLAYKLAYMMRNG